MTYLDNDQDYGGGPTIYPPRPPAPLPRRRGLLPALGFKSARDRQIEEQRNQYYLQQVEVYQNKLARDQERERNRLAKEQERMEREHRSEQVKIAEQQAKLQEAIASAKHAQDRLDQLQADKERYQAEPQKTSPVFGQLQKQLNDAKAKAVKTSAEVESRYRLIKPLLDKLRVPAENWKTGPEPSKYGPPDVAPPRVATFGSGFQMPVPFSGGSTQAREDYQANLDKALELDRGVPKGIQGQKAMPSFRELTSAATAARENIGAREMSVADKQEAMQRSQEDADRRFFERNEPARLAAQKELEDAQAKQQAARQILATYQNGGQEPSQVPTPAARVDQWGNVQRAVPSQPSFTQSAPQMQPQFGRGVQNAVNPGGKGAIPIPIVGPILSAVGSALAGGKGGGGMVGPGRGQMPPRAPGMAGIPIPPPRPQFERQQMLQAGQPPQIEQPATGGVQKATYEGEPYTYATPGGPQSAAGYGQEGAPVVVGDSIGLGLQREMGAQGNSEVGRSPAAVLQAIQANPDMYSGRDVVLSSGASNDVKSVGLLAQQIEALKAAGAKSVSVVGVGDRQDFKGLNDQIAKIAGASGARFLGPLKNLSKDHVHARSYRNFIDQIRRPVSPGAVNGRGVPPNAPQQRAAGSTGQPPLFTQMAGAGTVRGPAGTLIDQIAAGARKYGVDPRLALGLAASEGGPGLLRGASWHPHNDPSYSGHPGISYGPFQLRNPGLGTEFLRRYGALPNPSNVQQQIDFVMPYLARGQFKPWSAFKDRGGPARIAQIGASYLPTGGGGGASNQMAGAAPPPQPSGGFARGSGQPLTDQAAAPPPAPQKQPNPIAAGLSAIRPAAPTVQMTEPGPIAPPPQPQQTPYIPLPFAPEKATDMDYLAHGAMMRGLSKQDVAKLMKQKMPNDQLPAWLMEQQQEQQDAGQQ